ncbi:pentatricopeptide repeat-containing protein At1g30610, chloroplastic isoform X2 [Rhododendron vialii]|uniref:pentatricopeptide repeat-containing protein At1g30610, chloroplastic isoform X2 n=1 Tax=Rhododendron vialii TaxID=182163 RepID=UPI00265EF144|nr:pentatricopeptide repeat-containing protein At1g30610, chloroplastic isoform X2 [Rhododendron vialii]
MGLSLCERNGILAQSCCSHERYFSGGFSIPRRPTFGVAMGVKKVNHSWVFGLRTRSGGDFNYLLKAEASSRSVDGNLLEKKLEFKPSFDEYLKAMESVRTDREKKQTLSSERYNLNNEGNISLRDSEGDSSGGQVDGKEIGSRGLKGVKKMGFEEEGNFGSPGNLVGDQLQSVYRKLNMTSENRRWEKGKSKSVQESKRSGELKGVKKIGFEEKANSGISHNNLVQDKMDVKERKYDVGIDRKWDMDSGNGRWVKRKDTGVEGSKRNGELKGVKMLGFEEEANLGISHSLVQHKLDVKERKYDVGIDRNSENARWVKSKYTTGERSKRNGELKGVKMIGFEEKANSGISYNNLVQHKLNVKERKYDMGIDRDSKNGIWVKRNYASVEGSMRNGESKGVKTIGFEEEANSGISYNLVHHKLHVKERKYDVGIERKWNMDSENGRWVKRKYLIVEESKRNGELDRHRFKTDKGSLRGTNTELERNYSHIGKRSVESVKFRRNYKPIVETSDDDEVELERAAFKPLEGFNDVVDKPRVSWNEMEERIQKLARCLNGADIDMPEWMFSKMMRSAQIRFSDHAMLRIIQILGKLGNWRRVLQLIEWLQLRDRFKSYKIRNIQTTALAVLGKARRPVEALNLFLAMQQQMSTYPDLVAYHCIAVTLGQAGHMKELFDVIDSMRSPPTKKFKTGIIEKWDPRLEPDIIVYNAVLNACVQRKQWEGAFWVLQKIKEQGQRPSSTTYGLVMEVMFACGKYNLVHDFFNKVTKSSIPNALTYKVVVNTLWKEGKTDEAISVVESMERRGIIGSAALYYDLARCLCSTGRCQEALTQRELLETTWKHLARAGQTPPPLLAKEMFCVKLEQGDHASALSSISSHHSSELQVFSRNSWLHCFKENTHRFQKDSLVRLVHEGSIMMSRSDSRNQIFENLVNSCREFLEDHATSVSEMYSTTNSQQT